MAKLTISPETVCYIIAKAREFDVKVEPSEIRSETDADDDEAIDILEDRADDPILEELASAMESLNEDESLDLVVLMWIGRGDYTRVDWRDAREQAEEIPQADRPRYLLGTPLLGDYLEEGLAEFGHSCADYDVDRL